jgi:hypothetical protein
LGRLGLIFMITEEEKNRINYVIEKLELMKKYRAFDENIINSAIDILKVTMKKDRRWKHKLT